MNTEELSKWSDGELRIKCAEVLGWVNLVWGWRTPEGVEFGRGMLSLEACVPNYPSDLNAMHEAEKALANRQYSVYVEHLNNVVSAANTWRVVGATARQRCIAFIATMTATDVKRQPRSSNEAA